MAQLPLSHIRVVDTSMVYAGPTCGRILAELGADVIKVESLQRPEGTRSDRFIDNDGGARPSLPHGLDVLRFLLAGDAELAFRDQGVQWRWSRRD